MTECQNAINCLNPWDSQSERIYDAETATWHAFNANSGGGMSRDGILQKNSVCFQQNQRNEVRLIGDDGSVAGCLNAESGKKNTNYISENNTQENQNMPKLPRMTVRRLLPVEAERLFGLPDGHTIPCFKSEDITDELVDRFIEIFFIWDCFCRSMKKKDSKLSDTEAMEDDMTEPEPTDEVADESEIEQLADGQGISPVDAESEECEFANDGDVEQAMALPKRRSRKWIRAWLAKVSNPETCPDAPRYKAIGNSFGCNCIRWIGLGIQAMEDSMAQHQTKKKETNMKKIIAIIAILATITVALAQKPNNIGCSEVIEVEATIRHLVGMTAKDAEGSPYIRVEVTSDTSIIFIRLKQKWPRSNGIEIATLTNGKLQWQPFPHVSFLAANPKEKGTFGFVSFKHTLGSRIAEIPSVNLQFAGWLETEWREDEQRFAIVGGSGKIAGMSNASSNVKLYTDEATFGLQDRCVPAEGDFTVRPCRRTEAQMAEIISSQYRR